MGQTARRELRGEAANTAGYGAYRCGVLSSTWRRGCRRNGSETNTLKIAGPREEDTVDLGKMLVARRGEGVESPELGRGWWLGQLIRGGEGRALPTFGQSRQRNRRSGDIGGGGGRAGGRSHSTARTRISRSGNRGDRPGASWRSVPHSWHAQSRSRRFGARQDELFRQLVMVRRYFAAEHDQLRVAVALLEVAEHLIVSGGFSLMM